jgi:hypothetical protein
LPALPYSSGICECEATSMTFASGHRATIC